MYESGSHRLTILLLVVGGLELGHGTPSAVSSPQRGKVRHIHCGFIRS